MILYGFKENLQRPNMVYVYIVAGLRYISAKLIEINGFKEDKF